MLQRCRNHELDSGFGHLFVLSFRYALLNCKEVNRFDWPVSLVKGPVSSGPGT